MMLFSRRQSMFLLVSFLSSTLVTVTAGPSAKVRWRLLPLSVPSLEASDLPEIAAGEGVVAVIASPDTPSAFVAGGGEIDVSGNNALSLQRLSDNDDAPMVLVCRGATLSDGDSDADDDSTSTSTCLSVTSLVADSIIVDGLTEGDVEAGLESSRHARTLTAIFRSRVLLMDTHDSNGDPLAPQTLVLCVSSSSSSGEEEEVASQHVAAVEKQVEDLYQAVAAQSPTALSFKSRYKLRTVFCPTASDAQQLLAEASDSAKPTIPQDGAEPPESGSLSAALAEALTSVSSAGATMLRLDPPPQATQALVTVSAASRKVSQTVHAQLAAWKARASRGLVVDNFGAAAEALRASVLDKFDEATVAETCSAAAAGYRRELRANLQQNTLDAPLEELYNQQVENLEASTLQRFNKQLLKNAAQTIKDLTQAEEQLEADQVALRTASFAFSAAVEKLEVPTLGCTKEKAIRSMADKLNNALQAFPESPAAKLQRTAAVEKVVNKEKEPGERSFGVGVDLVAMLRPDGYGSFQGFAGYQLPGGNAITVGIHNDADDPQVIAQFGGVRPPLMRVQPKIKLDVEL